MFGYTIAGHEWNIAFEHPETVAFFSHFVTRPFAQDIIIKSTPSLIEQGRSVLPSDVTDAYIESRTLINITAKQLLSYGSCIFHSVSFLWRGYAWLLAAPSGTGKTTQFLNWQGLYPEEVEMICGDMPVLERSENGEIIAHPSPWNGKENLSGKKAASVAGIVFLKQGDVNQIERQAAQTAIIPMLEQFIVCPETEDQIQSLAQLMDQILRTVPVFSFTNRGDIASTEMLRNTLSMINRNEINDEI